MPSLDICLLFVARIVRLFAYGGLSVVLALYLADIGFSEGQIGLILSLTLVGDAAISLWLTTRADRLGRRKMLVVGAGLMVLAGVVFLVTKNPVVLVIAAIIGVISPSGNDIGPFLSIELAGLAHLVADKQRTKYIAWYNLTGSFATALGALAAGWLTQLIMQTEGATALNAYRTVLAGYAGAGLLLIVCFRLLSKAMEAEQTAPVPGHTLGLHKSKSVIFKLSALFALDAFAGGLIVQSLLAYWFHVRFGADTGVIGSIFFGANLLAGISSLLAVPMARKFGLINTMVFTHIPSNLLLILVPFMPTLHWAIGVLLVRFMISQMDVPTRQSYTMAVVAPDERSAASGVTTIARSVGASLSPVLAGLLLSVPALLSAPIILCGGLKIVYDLALWRQFSKVKPPEEKP